MHTFLFLYRISSAFCTITSWLKHFHFKNCGHKNEKTSHLLKYNCLMKQIYFSPSRFHNCVKIFAMLIYFSAWYGRIQISWNLFNYFKIQNYSIYCSEYNFRSANNGDVVKGKMECQKQKWGLIIFICYCTMSEKGIFQCDRKFSHVHTLTRKVFLKCILGIFWEKC